MNTKYACISINFPMAWHLAVRLYAGLVGKQCAGKMYATINANRVFIDLTKFG